MEVITKSASHSGLTSFSHDAEHVSKRLLIRQYYMQFILKLICSEGSVTDACWASSSSEVVTRWDVNWCWGCFTSFFSRIFFFTASFCFSLVFLLTHPLCEQCRSQVLESSCGARGQREGQRGRIFSEVGCLMAIWSFCAINYAMNHAPSMVCPAW